VSIPGSCFPRSWSCPFLTSILSSTRHLHHSSYRLGGIAITFIRQPELSTTGGHSKLLLAIYSYFAETEREFISIRTKQGLAAARASGKRLGRPKGSRNRKQRVLDPFKPIIAHYLCQQIPIASIMKIINPQLDKPLSYNSYKYYILRLS
jgi:hypothetical protein